MKLTKIKIVNINLSKYYFWEISNSVSQIIKKIISLNYLLLDLK